MSSRPYPQHGKKFASGSNKKLSPTYITWQRMRARCLRANSVDYARYGGRGITICERWDSFENFLADMGERPEGLQLDRIDNDGPYCPENCRWVSKRANARNRSSNVLIVIDGVERCATEWAEINGLNPATVLGRIKSGWDPVKAATTPKGGQR